MRNRYLDVIINATQHLASEDQQREGVFESSDPEGLHKALTFDDVPNHSAMTTRALRVCLIVRQTQTYLEQFAADQGLKLRVRGVMIGGAPYFMRHLEDALLDRGFTPMYAFSRRESVDLPDGRKQSVFRHAGWVTIQRGDAPAEP